MIANSRAKRNESIVEMNPITEVPFVVAGEVGTALLHFNGDQRLPVYSAKAVPPTSFFAFRIQNSHVATDVEEAVLDEGLKQPIEKNLRFAFFVTRDVRSRPVDEFLQVAFAVRGRAVTIHNGSGMARCGGDSLGAR